MDMTFTDAPLSSGVAAEGNAQALSRRRHKDFLAACRRIVASQPKGAQPLMVGDVARLAAQSPAPCYYVSFDYALRMYNRILRQGTSGVLGPMGRCWQEIADKVRGMVDRSEGRLSVKQAMARVLAGESASSFFLSPPTARRLYHHALRQRRLRPHLRK